MLRPGPTLGTRLRLPTAAQAGALQRRELAFRTGLSLRARLLLPKGAGAAVQQQRGQINSEVESCRQGLRQGDWPGAVYHDLSMLMRCTCMAFQDKVSPKQKDSHIGKGLLL